MAVYFDYPIHSDNDADKKNNVLAWHRTSSILAIGSTEKGRGLVQFYLDEVQKKLTMKIFLI